MLHLLLWHAVWKKYGADAVVAEGMESGGHIGEETTMTLVPQVADAVSIPVIAAGGIGDGRGIAAAFMLGAEAVQIGTRFVVSKESIVHENYKERIIKGKRYRLHCYRKNPWTSGTLPEKPDDQRIHQIRAGRKVL